MSPFLSRVAQGVLLLQPLVINASGQRFAQQAQGLGTALALPFFNPSDALKVAFCP